MEEEEDNIENERKRIIKERMVQEIVKSNRISILNKQQKIAKEKEEDLKILKYNMDKKKRKKSKNLGKSNKEQLIKQLNQMRFETKENQKKENVKKELKKKMK